MHWFIYKVFIPIYIIIRIVAWCSTVRTAAMLWVSLSAAVSRMGDHPGFLVTNPYTHIQTCFNKPCLSSTNKKKPFIAIVAGLKLINKKNKIMKIGDFYAGLIDYIITLNSLHTMLFGVVILRYILLKS